MYYPGNKNIPGLIQKIINQVPPCICFYEPFCGSAAVSRFLAVLPGIETKFFVNDLDPLATSNFKISPGTTVTNKNGFDILNNLIIYGSRTVQFIFIDPPYHHSTRSDRTDIYTHEFTSGDHIQLLKFVLQLKCNCMIIHPVCDLYDHALKSWRSVPITVRYHNKTSHEKLYMNYPRPEQLLTYVCAGKDCWDRQRIKRKGDRLISKLMSLPPMERNYIIDRIMKSF